MCSQKVFSAVKFASCTSLVFSFQQSHESMHWQCHTYHTQPLFTLLGATQMGRRAG